MKERIMGKGSIKGRLGKDDRAAETKDPTDKSCLAHTFLQNTPIYTPGFITLENVGCTCMYPDRQDHKNNNNRTNAPNILQTSTFYTNPDVSHNPWDRCLGSEAQLQ